MTYMAGFNGEYAIDCQYLEGQDSNIYFTKGENVYFLGKNLTNGQSADYLGFPGYFKIQNSPSAIVSRFEAPENRIYLVSNGQNLPNFENRGICIDDIIVGAKSRAVRKIGTNFKEYFYNGSFINKTNIKELGYLPSFHDLLDFSLDDRAVNLNLENPFNSNFFKNTIFSNEDNKFSCVTLSNRFELPIPYTADIFTSNLAVAVTPQHVITSKERPIPTVCRFYDPESDLIVNKIIIKTIEPTSEIFGDFYKNEDNQKMSIQGSGIFISILDSPLPGSIIPASVPDVAFRDLSSTYIRRMDSLLIDDTFRGYYMNASRGGRISPIISHQKVERFEFGVVNSSLFMENIIDMSSAPLHSGAGDSNSLLFTCINNKLVSLGSVISPISGSAGLDGYYLGEDIYSELDVNFPWYPDRNGFIVNSPRNRYRDNHFWGTNSIFWLTIGNIALRYLFTSRDVWGIDVNPSFVPSRIKITNDINILEPSTTVNVLESNLIGNKIKFIS